MSFDNSATALQLPEEIDLPLELANIGSRSLAYIVDWLLSFVLPFLITMILKFLQNPLNQWIDQFSSGTLSVFYYLFFFGSQWAYYNLFEWSWNGQTPGKLLLGLRVIKADGTPINGVDIFLRNLVRPLDTFFPFSFVGLGLIFFTQKSQRLGDLLAQTLVIREVKIDWSIFEEAGERVPHRAVPRLEPIQWEMLQRFLHRRKELEPKARAEIATRLRERMHGLTIGTDLAQAPLSAEEWLVEFSRRC